MKLDEIIETLKGQTIVKDGCKPIVVSSYDRKKNVFMGIKKGEISAITMEDIITGRAVIQDRLF